MRQLEPTDGSNVEQQIQQKRETRLDAVRIQGEKQLKKVN